MQAPEAHHSPPDTSEPLDEQSCGSSDSSPARESASLSSLSPSPDQPTLVRAPSTRLAWMPHLTANTAVPNPMHTTGPSTWPPPSEPTATPTHHPVTSMHPTPNSSTSTTPLAREHVTYFNQTFKLPSMASSNSEGNMSNLELRVRTKARGLSACPTATHSSACSTPMGTHHHASSSPLLALPDQLLVEIWTLLDPMSRAALYHTCRALWTNTTLNALLTTCSCNTLDDLVTWPRNAGPPARLRLVNGHPSPTAPPPTPEYHPSPYAEEGGNRSFELLLAAARENLRAMEVLSGVTHVIMQGRGKGSELCKRLAWLLGPLCPRLSKLLVDWCSMGGETCVAASCWLPGLTHLTLNAVNSMELRGTWPQPLLTYSDLASLTNLTHLELIDCHLPFLELGVQDVTPLSSLANLQSLHLVYSSTEHEWPGSKPCYLLLGLSEVSHGCTLLKELVLDGVQHAKMGAVHPTWPSLTDMAVGYLSGWHPSLLLGLALDTAAPVLRSLSLGKLVCNGHSPEAKQLFVSRCTAALTTLSASRVPPPHMEIYAPPSFNDQLPLAHVISSLHPLHLSLVSLNLHVDAVAPGDGRALAEAAPHLMRLQLSVRRACGTGIAEIIEELPRVSQFQLECEADEVHVGAAATDGNVLSACYAALSSARDGPLTIVVRNASVFVMLCMREMRHIKAASGHPVTFTTAR